MSVSKFITQDNYSGLPMRLVNIINGIENIHNTEIIYRSLHSGNILINKFPVISDFRLCKSSTEITDEIYGIVPYVSPDVFIGKNIQQLQIYIVLFEIAFDIITTILKGYNILMQKCWDSDLNKRPNAYNIRDEIIEMISTEGNNFERNHKIIEYWTSLE
ncbi:16441_t:CDS:2 [Funneliformis geosporum]|uniref:16441_t:CDS:1 n=1 Tax=Funneliformis geosporum TaxID=1117311 RepID=A0A9W4SKX1_9GLOM|nr:16441_t:CDS:2 [Funneliformis geosporum]